MDIQLYIGQKAVTESNEQDGKVQYTLADGLQDTVFKDQFDAMVQEAAYDEAMVRVYKWKPVVKEILDTLVKYDPKLMERQFILDRVDLSLIELYGKAIAKKFDVDQEFNVKLSDIQKALES